MAPVLKLTLYIDGNSYRSVLAQDNLQKLCEQHLGDAAQIEVVDISNNADIAIKEQIVALPTLIISGRGKQKRLVGDLSLARNIIMAYGLVARSKRMVAEGRSVLQRINKQQLESEQSSSDTSLHSDDTP